MKVTLGKHEWDIPSRYVDELRDSAALMANHDGLLARMREDGYLFIRGFHDREAVLRARQEVLEWLAASGRLDSAAVSDGKIGPANKPAAKQGLNLDMPRLLDVVNGSRVMNFFTGFLGGPVLTYDVKWVRAVARGEFTGCHYDVVYMGRGTKNLYTTWTPLGDIPYAMGGLTLCLGSQHFERIKATYGQMDVDRDNVTGWFSNDPKEIVDTFGGRWATAEFRAGDALIFGPYLMHGSATNTTEQYRLSVDTRYQLAADPVDERWYGENPRMHYAWQKGKTVTMEEARRAWGV